MASASHSSVAHPKPRATPEIRIVPPWKRELPWSPMSPIIKNATDDGAVMRPRRLGIRDGNTLALRRPLRRSRSSGQSGEEIILETIFPTSGDPKSLLFSFDVLLQSGPLKEFEFRDLLHLAASTGTSVAIELLLRRISQGSAGLASVNVRSESSRRWTALHYAAANNHKIVLQLLLNVRGIDVDALDDDGNTALLIASRKGHRDAVKILLQHSEAILFWNNEGLNCLTMAASRGHADVVRIILDSESSDQTLLINARTSQDWAPLHHATANSHKEVVKVLLQQPRIKVNALAEDGRTALVLACEKGNGSIVEMLLERGANPHLVDSVMRNCLHVAALQGYDKLVMILLEYAARRLKMYPLYADSQDAAGYTALMLASQGGHLRAVRILLLYKANALIVNGKGRNCLHIAAHGGHHEVIQAILVSSEIDVNVACEDGTGDTALIIASELGKEKAVETLLRHGADTLIYNYDEYSCVHAAANAGNCAIVKALVSYDDLVQDTYSAVAENRKDDAISIGSNWASLVRSTSEGRTLSDHEANMSLALRCSLRLMEQQTSRSAYTALHLAAQGNHVSLTLQLLKAYLSLILTMHGFTRHPLDHALVPEFFHLVSRRIHSKRHNNGEELVQTRKTLVEYWRSVESSDGSRDWKSHIRNELDISPGDEEHFVTTFVDVYVKLVEYSNVEDDRGRTFLHYIADQETTSCAGVDCEIRRLLEVVTLDVNAPDSQGNTPLHLAMQRGNRCFFRHCLIDGRDFDLLRQNEANHSVLELAILNSERSMDLKSKFHHGDVDLDNAHPLSTEHHHNSKSFQELETALIHRFTRVLKNGSTSSGARYVDDGAHVHTDKTASESLFRILQSFKGRLQELSQREAGKEESSNSERKVPEPSLKMFTRYGHYGGITLLHYVAFNGMEENLNALLECPKHQLLLNMQSDHDKSTALHYAVMKGHCGVVKALVGSRLALRVNIEDQCRQTPYEIVSEHLRSENPGKYVSRMSPMKDVEAALMEHPDIKTFIDKQYKDRQIHVDAGNTALVGAALIASVTFGGWLQPPLGYQDYHNVLADDGQPEQFAAVQRYPSVLVYWIFNSLSFFFAVATVVCGARAVLPAREGDFIAKEVRGIRRWLVRTSFLLMISIICVLIAFSAAGFAGLPPIFKYQTVMVGTIVVGGFVCAVVLIFYVIHFSRIMEQGLIRWEELFRLHEEEPIKTCFRLASG